METHITIKILYRQANGQIWIYLVQSSCLFMSSNFETNRRQELHTSSELMNLAGGIALTYVKESLPTLHRMVLEGRGRKVVGMVEARPEDDMIEIDSYGEGVIQEIIERDRLPLQVYSEHADPFIGPSGNIKLRAAFDPFDNSSEYKRGLPTPVYSCISFYDLSNIPLAGAIVELGRGKVYLSIQGENYVIDDFLKGTPPRRIFKSERKSILEEGATLAWYTGSNEYSTPIDERFGEMRRSMHIKARTFSNGGAFIYGPLAEGAVDAYVMPLEPRGEIDAGRAFSYFARARDWIRHRDGTRELYVFNPEKYRENVDLFVSAQNDEMVHQIMDFYERSLGCLGQSEEGSE